MSQVVEERDGHVGVVRLTAVERLNAFTPEDTADLRRIFTRMGEDEQIRCIVITGTGRAFCSGAEVSGLANRASAGVATDTSPEQRGKDTGFTPRRLGIYKPVVAAVNGVCAGAGLHFLADADIVIASESATFLDTHTDIGQVTALEPILFAKCGIPMNAVLRMVILGRADRMSAAAALRSGMVSEVLPDAKLMPRAMEIGQIASSVSPTAVQASIRAIWSSMNLFLTDAYNAGYEAIGNHRAHPDAYEGARAFVEKRKPVWATPGIDRSE